MKTKKRFVYCEQGTAAVEFAFVGFLLILGTVGIIEVGRALFMANELGHAADRAARIVMLQFDINEADLREAVQDDRFLTGLVPQNIKVEIVSDTDTGGAFRMVQLSYSFTPMLDGLSVKEVPLTEQRRIAR